MSRGTETLTDWRRLPADPDLERDLGYELMDWEAIRTRKNGAGSIMFLPDDVEMLRDDAFIVASTGAVCDVDNWE